MNFIKNLVQNKFIKLLNDDKFYYQKKMTYFCSVLKLIFNKIITFPLVILIKLYQWIISPLLPSNCRYHPTCSHYMLEALKVHGIFKGFYMGVKRILRCHPWGSEGYDPVPPKCKH